MVNQNSIFGGMLTSLGAAKKTNCDALGIPWEPSYMLIGDANDTDPVPSPGQTQLIRQVYRAPLNALYVSPTDDKVLIAELVLPPEVGGWWIRELAIEDKDGVFCAVANVAPSYKPLLAQGSGRNQVVRMHIITNSTTNIQLKIDPSVVLATRSYVDQRILEELNKQDFKHSVLVATSGTVTLSGLQTIDSVVLAAGNRVLVKNQAQAKDNGLYVAATGAWSRTQDADTSLEVTPGLFVHVEKGVANGDSVWQLVTDGPIVLGTTDLTFEMVAGRTGVNAGTYTKVTVDKYGRVIAGTNPSTLAGHGITDTYTKPEIEALVAQASSLPVGSIVAFPKASVPPGFLEVDGSVQSVATYPDLAAYLGTTFNKGDEGAGNFRLPESRGEFLRGWDHGRGVDAGRGLGSKQLDAMEIITGNVGGVRNDTASVSPSGPFSTVSEAGNFATGPGRLTSVVFDSSKVVKTATETRPRNLAVMWCIKAWNAPINQGAIDISALAPLATQATEINQGTAKVATTAQMLDSANDLVMPTPKKLRWGLSVSLASNGYIAAPFWLGGWVIQWGTTGAVSPTPAVVSFPMAFPSEAYVALAIGYLGQTNVGANQDAIYSFGLSKNGVSFKTYGSSVTNGAKYIAIGS
ncbi:phage tail protein [Pseudomonas protegens]|uniref:phage tail-collar fiber domain-containing protein n=1 Tax=Pseudomonas protegens TaxID=380021 RepID=UPI000D94A419|nr:phage tail protein [Pseudomonas protegens]PYB98145.1 phage tail protein [Pseudomonas protegens]